ncbi:MAG: Hsp70 family protein [Oscillospiraceae bacterium]
MEKHYGFDLGDAECAVAEKTREDGKAEPQILTVDGAKSFISAFAVEKNGEVMIGENACYSPRASEVRLRFKSRFLTDPSSHSDMLRFVRGVLRELYDSGGIKPGESGSFYIGCPAGWDADTREQYRAVFEAAGYPPAKIVTESRAALMSACRSKHLQVSYDILSKPMLVIDMGSSTTDFAYILRGREIELQTAGEVFLGGGIMDEILLEEAIDSCSKADRLREIFAESSAWRSYCEFAARRLKEKYFSDEDYWHDRECAQSVVVRYRLPLKFTLLMNSDIADKLQNKKIGRLGNRSFMQVFCESLDVVRKKISEHMPQIVFLTGGVSKMPCIREIVRGYFPDAIVVSGNEPEFSVAKGLAWTGEVDEELELFKKDIELLKESDAVETIVDAHIDELFRDVVDELVEPILKNAAIPIFLNWRSGGIERLSEIDGEMSGAIDTYLRSDEVKELLAQPIARWIKPVADELEEKTIPICVKHDIPYTALSLTSFMSVSEINIKVDSKNVFAFNEISWLINAIISVLVGILCGGGGVALIAGGIPGIIAGTAISMIVLLIGKNKVQSAVMSAKIPLVMRRVIPKKFFDSRIDQIKEKVKETFYQNLQTEHNEAIRARLTGDISSEIEMCLTKMAEVVEIPLT